MLRIGINGFGRIGRSFYRLALERADMEVVAVNDLGDIDNLTYLLKYDSAQGSKDYHITVAEDKKGFVCDGHQVAWVSEREPKNLPWGEWNVDLVIESTGFFTKYEDAKQHLEAGAKRVVISAPGKGEPADGSNGATVLMGVNEELAETSTITSNGSCTTNASSPLIQILHEAIGIKKAMLSTVHAYTASQGLVDGPSKKAFRDGRAAAQNIIPSSTGAAVAVTEAVTDLKDKFDGIAFRVPVIAGSIADITFVAERATTVEEVNQALKAAAETERWQKVFAVTEEPIVSSDIVGSQYASIADLEYTKVVDGDLVKVLAWYDNEMGYTHALMHHVLEAAKYLS